MFKMIATIENIFLLRLNVAARIIGGYGVVLVLAATILFAGLYGINNIENSLHGVTDEAMPMSSSVGVIVTDLLQGQIELTQFEITASENLLDTIEKRYRRDKAQTSEALERLITLSQKYPQLKQRLNSVVQTHQLTSKAGDELISIHRRSLVAAKEVQQKRAKFGDFGDEILSYTIDLENVAVDKTTKNRIENLITSLDEVNTSVIDAAGRSQDFAVIATQSNLDSSFGDIDNLLAKIEVAEGIAGSRQWGNVKTNYSSYQSAAKNLLTAQIEHLNLDKQAKQYLGNVVESGQQVVAILNRLTNRISGISKDIESSAVEAVASSQIVIKSAAAVAILAAGLIGFFVTRSIRDPLNSTVEGIKKLAAGDLSSSIQVIRSDELGTLQENLNEMSERLRHIVGQVQESSLAMNTASNEVAKGNMELSQRTEEQASSLEETASSMAEMTATVKQSAYNAKEARQLAKGARDQAEKGGAVINDAVKAMQEINESSRQIADIISVVENIAFQTNLLALNAAVEAARAGEQGRGFAVVATEVRTLAQRSAEASKRIKNLIQDSVDKVDIGSKLVFDSGRTLGDIVESIAHVSDIVAEISTASEEQASGIEQVNRAVAQMDDMTQQNAALVEQAAAASRSMLDQSINLRQQVEFFKLSDELNLSQIDQSSVTSDPNSIAE